MAETIATALSRPGLAFASAGLDPAPVEPATKEFMRGKGCDVSRMAAKSINQVPNLDHYRVMVALADPVKSAFPHALRDVVFLDWSLPDPSRVQGSPDAVHAAYEQTYRALQERLKNFVAAVLGPSS
jgi:arsenate reductase